MTKMSNIAVIRADAHNHAHGSSARRAKECLQAYEWTYELAASIGAKWVIDNGDVFHDRQHVDTYTHSEVYRIGKKYLDKAGIKTVFVLGNHDMYLRESHDYSSIIAFESLGAVIDQPRMMEIGGRPVDFFPYVEHGVAGVLQKAFPDIRSELLCFHAAFENAIMSSASGMRRGKKATTSGHEMHEIEVDECLSLGAVDGWKLALGGHYHVPQVVIDGPCRVEYVGSTLQHCFGECGEKKRIMIIDLDSLETSDVFNEISPVFLKLNGDDDLGSTNVENARVRLLSSDPSSDKTRKLRREMERSGAVSVQVENKRVAMIDKQVQQVSIASANSWLVDGNAMVRRYAKLQCPDGLDRDRLVAVGYDIVRTAESGLTEE